MTTRKMTQDAHRKLGKWLKGKRRAAGLSQRQLAGLIGRTDGFIASLESGKRLDLEDYLTITRALKADPKLGIRIIQRCLR